MFYNTEIKKLEDAKIVSYQAGGRNTSIPSGTLLKDVTIKNSMQDIKLDSLYVPDTYEIGKFSTCLLIEKGGKHLIALSEDSMNDDIKSFREYYKMNSKEALIYLFIPMLIIALLIGIFSGLSSLKIYIVMTALSFIARTYTFRSLGDLFLCVSAPTYIYLLLRF